MKFKQRILITLTCYNISCGSIPGSPPHYFSLLHRGSLGNEIKEERGNETQEEFVQSQNCTAHSQNPETACLSQDCAANLEIM